jgi:hypothetical protein
MELILAILVAGPAGYFTQTRRRGLVIYLALWAVVFPIQTVVVFSESSHGSDALYWVLNALILCLGVGPNRLGSALGEHRRPKRGEVSEASAA